MKIVDRHKTYTFRYREWHRFLARLDVKNSRESGPYFVIRNSIRRYKEANPQIRFTGSTKIPVTFRNKMITYFEEALKRHPV
jgi:hypothetical protein